jgi:two-component system, NtrC family, response regulator PilR
VPNSLRLLWLDPDDRTVADGNLTLLEQGWVVDQARSLVEAIDRISHVAYDAVILDLQLPDTLGTDAWMHIRKLRPNMIGVMTTSSSSLYRLIRVDSPGLTAYLRKPLSMQEVVAAILAVMNENQVSKVE